MRISKRDHTVIESLVGDLLDLPEGDACREQAYRNLSEELVRNGPRGWLAPDGKIESVKEVAIGLWRDHVRDQRARRDAARARAEANTLLRWWDDLDVNGYGAEAVRMISQELRSLREPGVATRDSVREAHCLAVVWGFSPPPL